MVPHLLRSLLLLLLALPTRAQVPSAPNAHGSDEVLAEARRQQKLEDPLRALQAYRELRVLAPGETQALIGLGRVHLQLGRARLALLYAEAAIERAPRSCPALALRIEALLRGRRFEQALASAREALRDVADPDAALLAAHASALFRMQRNDEAAQVYRQVLSLDHRHAEAHLRLGSGLLGPTELDIPEALKLGLAELRQRAFAPAQQRFLAVLEVRPDHAIAHRLFGESVVAEDAASSMASTAPEYQSLLALLPQPTVEGLPLELFFPAYAGLSAPRRQIASRALALFSGHVGKLVTIGGRHDLLLEDERTTDAPARQGLRGKRTFDGRVWDDVRGMGGLQAATGIEALDEAYGFGFDTLTHEIAHQAHLYVFSPADRRRVRDLYRRAIDEGRCLDYYAASNEAEYFAQGVEAFVSYAKRPGRESTHGHTRFELFRVDPDLHDFVARVVSFDPLRDPQKKNALLAASVDVALRCGRASDAVVAAEMMEESPERVRMLELAARAERLARVY